MSALALAIVAKPVAKGLALFKERCLKGSHCATNNHTHEYDFWDYLFFPLMPETLGQSAFAVGTGGDPDDFPKDLRIITGSIEATSRSNVCNRKIPIGEQ
jgi:hypothetical protein